MVLLLGGTTEAKQVAAFLEKAGCSYIYSTRTQVDFEGKGKYCFGGLNGAQMEVLCMNEGVKMIVDACHPFAKELHQTVASVNLNIPLIRYQRAIPIRITHPLIEYVEDYEEVLLKLEQRKFASLLALSGVQSIPLLKKYWAKHKTWFRILDRNHSKELASKYNFPEEFLIYGMPQEIKEELALFWKLKPDVILTKESGLNGKSDTKIAAAIECNIQIMVLKIPMLPVGLQVMNDLEQLQQAISGV
ncbi:MAG: precorrin-6A/cobalt-precorrin-6A reductase [Opitutaceae bacterium]|nr:precorrin-6A/cobalt-precorrin-6A reductase [Cytophagales bacterium]